MPYLNRFPGAKESHEIEQIFTDDDKNYQCRVCLCTWKRKPTHGKCAGVPVYESWEDVHPELTSATGMYRDHKRKLPDDALPMAAVRQESSSYIPLYLIRQGNPDYKGKRKTTKPSPPPVQKPKLTQTSFDPFGWLRNVERD